MSINAYPPDGEPNEGVARERVALCLRMLKEARMLVEAAATRLEEQRGAVSLARDRGDHLVAEAESCLVHPRVRVLEARRRDLGKAEADLRAAIGKVSRGRDTPRKVP